jgi:hypothetical protein
MPPSTGGLAADPDWTGAERHSIHAAEHVTAAAIHVAAIARARIT